MTVPPVMLPSLLTLNTYNGDWTRYLEVLYAVFRTDFVTHPLTFRGLPVKVRSFPMDQGKEAAFWHLISEGEKEGDRLPDLRRCERIGWIRPCIEYSDMLAFKVWENERKGKRQVCIWLEEQEYLVVLGVRRDYYLLLSAYPVTIPNRKRRLQAEYEAHKANAAR